MAVVAALAILSNRLAFTVQLIFPKVLPNIGLPLLGLNPDEETQHAEPFKLFKCDTEAPRGISSWKSWNWILNSPPFRTYPVACSAHFSASHCSRVLPVTPRPWAWRGRLLRSFFEAMNDDFQAASTVSHELIRVLAGRLEVKKLVPSISLSIRQRIYPARGRLQAGLVKSKVAWSPKRTLTPLETRSL